jgi:hypothetical protein
MKGFLAIGVCAMAICICDLGAPREAHAGPIRNVISRRAEKGWPIMRTLTAPVRWLFGGGCNNSATRGNCNSCATTTYGNGNCKSCYTAQQNCNCKCAKCACSNDALPKLVNPSDNPVLQNPSKPPLIMRGGHGGFATAEAPVLDLRQYVGLTQLNR